MSTADVVEPIQPTAAERAKAGHVRYLVIIVVFLVTALNYADRATFSIAGSAAAADLQLSSVGMACIFSAFGWAYVIAQIPRDGSWIILVPKGSI